MKPTLTENDFARAAQALRCSTAAIKAVCQVEAPRGGFDADGQPVILFEGHKFSAFTNHKFDKTHPTLSYPTWTRQFYTGSNRGEHVRLQRAVLLDREAAFKAASWGKFQIMGFNYSAAGFPSLQAFINAMYRSEGAQLDAFVGFVLHEKLDDELRELRWADFARRYNGPGYMENKYDVKLAQAFQSFTTIA